MWYGTFLWNSMGNTKNIQWFCVFSGHDLEVAMATLTCPYCIELVTCSLLWYIRMPNWSRWRVMVPHHYSECDILFAFSSKAVCSSSHYIPCSRVLCCNVGIFCVVLDTTDSWVSTLHLVSFILAVPWSLTSAGAVSTASWRHSAELPLVLEHLFT